MKFVLTLGSKWINSRSGFSFLVAVLMIARAELSEHRGRQHHSCIGNSIQTVVRSNGMWDFISSHRNCFSSRYFAVKHWTQRYGHQNLVLNGPGGKMMKDRAFKKLPTLTVILSLLFLCFGVIYHLIVVQLIYLFFFNYIFFFCWWKRADKNVDESRSIILKIQIPNRNVTDNRGQSPWQLWHNLNSISMTY